MSLTRRAFVAGIGAFAAGGAQGAGSWSVAGVTILLGRHPADGVTMLTGGIRVENGVIAEIGQSVSGPQVDGVIWPGVWDAGSPLGMVEIPMEGGSSDSAEGSDAIQPQLRVTDGFNPQSKLLAVVRARGVMGALVVPGAGLVSGRAAWMRTVGASVADCTVLSPAGLVIRLGRGGIRDGGPSSRLGVASRLRDILNANPPPKVPVPEATGRKKRMAPPPEDVKPPTEAETVWHSVLQRKLKVIFVADRASDIEVACGLTTDYALDAVVLGGAEAHLVTAPLLAANVPVMLGPVTVQPDGFDTLHARYDNGALLHRAGVRLSLRLGDPHRAFDLTTEAGIAVAHGLPRDMAIAAITGNGPGFFGLTEGRLRVGAPASFVLSDGDPLEPRSRVLRVWQGGEELPLRNHQTDLYERFRSL